MCAMPPIIMVSSSDSVIRGMYGRTVSGASVWPMNTLAQTLVVSAPDTRITLVIASAMIRTMNCITPEVVQHAHQRGEEDDRGQHLEGEHEAELRGVHQAAEDEVRAGADEAEDLHEALAQGVEDSRGHRGCGGFR
jgi:hypothetical protein